MRVPILPRLPLVLVGVLVLMLAIFGPVILAEKIQDIETSGEGLVSFTEVIEHSHQTSSWNNTTREVYFPYQEFNEENLGSYSPEGVVIFDGVVLRGGDPYYHSPVEVSYDFDGYLDYLTVSSYTWIYILMNINFTRIFNDNANQVFAWSDGGPGNIPWHFYRIGWMKVNENGETLDAYSLAIGPDEYIPGPQQLEGEITPAQMNYGSTFFSGIPPERQLAWVYIIVEGLIPGPDQWIIDFQISPEFYQETEEVPNEILTWDNFTTTEETTYYIPYISHSSNPYYLTRISLLGSSGILGILTFLFWRGSE